MVELDDHLNDSEHHHSHKKDKEPTIEEIKTQQKKDTKAIVITIAIIAGIFALAFLIGYFVQQKKNYTPTIDELMQRTIEGDESENNYMYNGYAFVKSGNLWYTQYQVDNKVFNIPLHFSPKEVETIDISGELDDKKFNFAENLYITFDPIGIRLDYVALSAAELSLNLARGGIGKIPQAACTKNETEACYNRPIVTCEDSSEAVIFLKDEEPTQITLNGTCITLQGRWDELLKSTDRLIYQWYGIIGTGKPIYNAEYSAELEQNKENVRYSKAGEVCGYLMTSSTPPQVRDVSRCIEGNCSSVMCEFVTESINATEGKIYNCKGVCS